VVAQVARRAQPAGSPADLARRASQVGRIE
jgi:hypothetical protein